VALRRKSAKRALAYRRSAGCGGLAVKVLRGLQRPCRRRSDGSERQMISCPCTWRGMASYCEARHCSASQRTAKQGGALQSVLTHGRPMQGTGRASLIEARHFHGTAGGDPNCGAYGALAGTSRSRRRDRTAQLCKCRAGTRNGHGRQACLRGNDVTQASSMLTCEALLSRVSSGVGRAGVDPNGVSPGAGARMSRSRQRDRVSQLCHRPSRLRKWGGSDGQGCLLDTDVKQASSMPDCGTPLILVGSGEYATEVTVSPELGPCSIRKVMDRVRALLTSSTRPLVIKG